MVRAGLGSIALSIFSAAVLAQSSPVPTERQLQVNTFTTNTQADAAVAVGADGSALVVWRNFGAEGANSRLRIQGRRFASSGEPAGEELAVDQDDFCIGSYGFAICPRRDPAIAADEAGGFVVAWAYRPDLYDSSIRARRCDGTGVPLGPELDVSPDFEYYSYAADPWISGDGSGGFLITWVQEWWDYPSDSTGILGRLYDAAGEPRGPAFQVNSYATGRPRSPAVAHSAGGDFLVVWHGSASPGTDVSGASIQARRFDANGVPAGTDFQVNDYTPGMQVRPAVGSDTAGNFVVAWESWGSDGDDSSLSSVQARRFDAAGQPLGPQFQVNEVTEGTQGPPALAVQPDGRFLVVWPSGKGLSARRFDASGNALGLEFPVNGSGIVTPTRPSVAAAPGGDFVVAWSSYYGAGDDDGETVQVRRIINPLIFKDGLETGPGGRWSSAVR